LSGGGWAEPKNGEAYFWAWVGGVSAANTAKANFLKNVFVPFFPFFSNLSNYAKISTLFFFKVALLLGCPRIASNVVAASRRRGHR